MRDTSPIDRALAKWLGKDSSPWPLRDDAAVIEAFGPVEGSELLVALRTLESDFCGPSRTLEPVPLADLGLAQTTESRAAAFRTIHPTLSDTVVALLSWAHSYDTR